MNLWTNKLRRAMSRMLAAGRGLAAGFPLAAGIPLAAGALLIGAAPVFADDAALRARVEQLSAELDALRAELRMQPAGLSSGAVATALRQDAAPASTALPVDDLAATAPPADAARVSLFGYGEVNYVRPRKADGETRMDMRRAVFGIGYAFDDRTRLITEFETEHAIVSADDEGEFEVEQFYVEHRLNDASSVKAGLFLIPAGLLNLSHEPTAYYGVTRNFTETAIIPSTWREGGIGVFGSTEQGIAWDVGVTTGFALGGWDPAGEGQESPLGSIHQELQLARASDLSVYAAVNYRGLPGFTAGASVFTGKAGQDDEAAPLASDARITLWDAHVRWAPGDFDLTALYARGHISDTRALNLTFVGNPVLIPEAFWGGYVQAAYNFNLGGSYAVAPFLRFERFNTGAEYQRLGEGLTPDELATETVWTYGFSFRVTDGVVLKADYQTFDEAEDGDRMNLGLGVSF